MTKASRYLSRAGLALMIGLVAAAPVSAQDASDADMAAARAAIKALGATDQFDNILPNAAEALKSSLIQANPNFQEVISATVDMLRGCNSMSA